MNINHERLVPGAITYWGDVLGDITDQQDLVDYVASHGGGGSGDATWGSIQGTLSNQTDLNNRLTDIDGLALDAYTVAKDTSNSLEDHIAANDAAFAEAFSRISALEQGGGGVTPEEFNAHKAQNTAEFQDFDGRIKTLEQNPGVSQQTFAAHADQNNAQFQAVSNDLQNINNQFQNYATRDYANQLYQSSIDIANQSIGYLSTSIDELRNTAVTTEQCKEPGLTDYILTSLVWNGSPAILAMDDHYTGDNAENRDVTIWGSYMDVDDDSRVKFGKVETTYEQDPNTQEYTVTGQTFGEMMTLTRKEGIDFPVVDRPNASIVPEDYSGTPYILSMSETYGTIEEDGNDIRSKSVDYLFCTEDQNLIQRHRTYHEVNGEWELQNETQYEPAWNGSGWDVAQIHDLMGDPDYQDRLGDFPVEAYFDIGFDKLPFGMVEDESGNAGEALSFNGFCWDQENEKLGLYKVTPIDVPGVGYDGYDESFIPFVAAEEPDTSTDATYVLKATVQDGEVTYEWVPDNVL